MNNDYFKNLEDEEKSTIENNITSEDILKDIEESLAQENQPENMQIDDQLVTDTIPEAIPEEIGAVTQEQISDFKKDPLEYIREKYKIGKERPETSFEDLKKIQERTGKLETISDIDKSLGKLGSWYDVEAKRRGYDVPGYTGGALERVTERERREFAEKQAFQTEEEKRLARELGLTKEAFSFEKQLGEFEKGLRSEEEMNRPDSATAQIMRNTISEIYGRDILPENVSANQILRVFPNLADITKTKLQSDLQRQLQKEKYGFEKELTEAEVAAKKVETAEKPTKGEERTDVEFAKKYADWVGEKGSIGADKGIANLETAITEMEKNPELTGGAGGLIYAVAPESVKSALNEKIGMIETRLRSAVVDTLRPLLGAQFAAVEGERIFKQTFDPNQSMSENISRAKLVLNDLKNQVESRKRAVDYWEKSGTLKGYKAFESRQPQQPTQFKAGDVREKDGKRYIRGEDGKWRPVSE